MKYELRMVEIRISFIFFLIVSDTNAGRIASASREIAKLIRPRNRNVHVNVNAVPLQKDFEKDGNVKTGEEFEIALATERLGFVYCGVKQESFMGRFVKEYLSISEGHSALLLMLDPYKVTRDEAKNVITACTNFLKDDVLRESSLRLSVVDEDFEQVQAVERVVHFDYFSAKPYKFAALQCPVRTDDQYDTKIKKIFFSALGQTDDDEKVYGRKKNKPAKNVDGVGRPYYVFADYTQNDKSKFKILMRTVQHDPKKYFVESSPPRADRIKSMIFDNPQRCPIRLYVRPERFKDEFRLFGKDAEAAFLTEMLRFYNKSYSPNKLNRFLDIVLEMKKGYEVLSYYEWISKFNTGQSGELSVFNVAIPFDCPKYVKGAKLLQQYRPIFAADYRISLIKTVPLKIRLKISGKRLERPFYQCPVTFTSKVHSGPATVNVIPVTYRSAEKCKEHAFYYIIVNENTSKEHTDFFFSRVEETEEGVEVLESLESAQVMNAVIDDEADGGDESVAMGLDGEAKPERGVKSVGDGKQEGGLEPVKPTKPATEVDPASSGDLSESLDRGDRDLHDFDNDADVSEKSGSIGVSGELPPGLR